MSREIRASAVLLDMDGTLVDSTAVVERLWSDWAVAHELRPSDVLQVVHGRQGHESMALLLPERPHDENIAENQLLLAQEVRQTGGVVAIAGAAQLLESLAGFPHALVTSATLELATVRMQTAGLAVPEVAVTAENVSASKPDPEGFLAAAALLEVPATECVVFEDSATGIAAARAAGMHVIGVGRSARAHGADWTVDDLSRIRVTAHESSVTITA